MGDQLPNLVGRSTGILHQAALTTASTIALKSAVQVTVNTVL